MISPKVMVELHQAKLVPTQFTVTKPGEHAWSAAEQRRFWEAIHRFPQGPWTAIAAYVGSKSTRQAMTHAQKLRQKLNRWKRRVRNDSASHSSSSSSGASSPRSDMNEYDDENDDDALCAMDHDNQSTQVADDLKHDQQELEYNNQHEHNEPTKSYFELAAAQSPDDVVACDNDAYLDHLLSDIEPVLEHVAIFTSSPRSEFDAMLCYSSEFADVTTTSSSSYDSSSKQPLVDNASMFALYSSPHFALATVGSHQQQQQYQESADDYAVDFRL